MPIKHRGATYMTVSELSDLSGIHRNTILYWIRNGKIVAERKGLAEQSPFVIEREEAERVIQMFANGNGTEHE